MSMKTVTAALEGDGLRLVATTSGGHTVAMDDATGDSAPRPAELLLVAQAGCTAMDVISILRKKKQSISSYEVRVAGEQRDDPYPHVFERILIVHAVEGDVSPVALQRAIELSATKYCTVTGNLASGVAEIRHAYVIRDPQGEKTFGEVLVTGPGMAPAAAAPEAVPG
ncbi:MAG TPA: OsmC family protein [Candidatus Deferrimicrobiaceae bacterium]|nr:OsmC family protein [Candidatus Deferrimicrobiaceae bacterium]